MVAINLCLYPAASLAASSSGPPALKAGSAVLMEAERGQVLYAKDGDNKLHVSTACKIMTALITIEKSKPDSKVTISKEAASATGAFLNLEVGEKYDIGELLHAMILTSANDAAYALAEFVAGDQKKFVELMNVKASELKMFNTVFSNTTGLYDEKQYTTANDFALLIRYAISNATFQRYFSSTGLPWNYDNNAKILVNSNKLFWSYEGIDGGKTGFNVENKQTAVTTATRNSLKLISIILDSPADNMYKDSESLLDYGFGGFRKGTLVQKSQIFKTISVNDKPINLISREDTYYTYPVGENYIVNIELKVKPDIAIPVKQDQVLGIASYSLKDGTKIDISLYPDDEILPEESTFNRVYEALTEHKEIFFVIVVLIVIEIILILKNIIGFIKRKIFTRKK